MDFVFYLAAIIAVIGYFVLQKFESRKFKKPVYNKVVSYAMVAFPAVITITLSAAIYFALVNKNAEIDRKFYALHNNCKLVGLELVDSWVNSKSRIATFDCNGKSVDTYISRKAYNNELKTIADIGKVNAL